MSIILFYYNLTPLEAGIFRKLDCAKLNFSLAPEKKLILIL